MKYNKKTGRHYFPPELYSFIKTLIKYMEIAELHKEKVRITKVTKMIFCSGSYKNNKTREDSRASQRKGENNKSDQNDILFRVSQK